MDLTLCLTHACNLRCRYCYAGPKFPRRMEWETARKAIGFAMENTAEQARLSGREAKCQIGFFGGEPLLEWDTLRRATEHALALAETAGVRLVPTVTTNMTLLDAPKAEWLRERGFHVGLSLDGNAAMHDTLRRTAGGAPSHARCAPALEFYKGPEAAGEVIVVLDPENISFLADSFEWLVEKDIRRVSFNPNHTAHWNDAALAEWRAQYARVAEIYVETYRRGTPWHVNVLDGKIRVRINGGYRPCDRCGFGETEVAVSAAGWFYPCERLVGDDTDAALRIGHVDSGFDAAARGRILANRGNTVAECATCPASDRCANWCGCVNYAATGFINRVPGLVCFHEKLCIETADRAAAILFGERNPAFLAKYYGRFLRNEWPEAAPVAENDIS